MDVSWVGCVLWPSLTRVFVTNEHPAWDPDIDLWYNSRPVRRAASARREAHAHRKHVVKQNCRGVAIVLELAAREDSARVLALLSLVLPHPAAVAAAGAAAGAAHDLRAASAAALWR